jgi:membrane-associated protease RseP (regulator of RpoE activity)
MRHPLILSACLAVLLPVPGVAAETEAVDSFVLDISLPQLPQSAYTVAVRCQTGCLWTDKVIECPTGRPCHAVIASSNVVDSIEKLERHEVEARAIAGSVCLGLQTKSDPPPREYSQRCQETTDQRGNPSTECEAEEVPTPDTRVILTAVTAGSPAEQAGLRAGDVVATFNGVPMRVRTDLFRAIERMRAGQSFEASLRREGAAVVVRGRLGIRMSDQGCAVADEKLLRTAQKLEPAPFLVEVDGFVAGTEIHCVQGCSWAIGPYSTSGPPETRFSATFDQNDVVTFGEHGDRPSPGGR